MQLEIRLGVSKLKRAVNAVRTGFAEHITFDGFRQRRRSAGSDRASSCEMRVEKWG
jgi:hypothetical protein